MKTSNSPDNIVSLSDIRTSKQRVLSPYGPVRVGLTTSLKTREDHQLTELLNSLESAVESLQFKSFTVYDTLVIAIEAMRVALSDTLTGEGGTDETP